MKPLVGEEEFVFYCLLAIVNEAIKSQIEEQNTVCCARNPQFVSFVGQSASKKLKSSSWA